MISRKIGILNYDQAGNSYSVKKAILSVKESSDEIVMVTSSDLLDHLDKLIIPGVGNFNNVLNQLSPLKEKLIAFSKKKWLLGICVGMQILCGSGEETSAMEGMGIFDGHVGALKINIKPNVGFSSVLTQNRQAHIWNQMPDSNLFYFMHSFAVQQSQDETTKTVFPCEFVASMQKDYAIGVQFHPEKSKKTGLYFLKKFLELNE